jgi:hypothetical protein
VHDEVGAVVDLLSHPGFWSGLGAGIAALGVLGFASRWRSPRGWAIAFAGSVTIAFALRAVIDVPLFVVLAVLAAGGVVVDTMGAADSHVPSDRRRIALWVGVLVVALLLESLFDPSQISWMSWTLPVVVVTAAAGIWLCSNSGLGQALGPMVAISVAGIWVTVPETDVVTAVVGAAIPLGLATLPPIRAIAWSSGSLALGGLLAWVVVLEGASRPWTIVASWATLAPLVAFGFLGRLRKGPVGARTALMIHLVFVFAITRVADMTQSTWLVASSAMLLVLVASLAFVLVPDAHKPAELSAS